MILVTGASGHIGRRVVAELLANDLPVRVLLPEARQGDLPWDMDNPPEIVTGSIADDVALFKAVTGAHVVIHLENAQWWGRPRELERVELAGTRNLVEAARAARVGRIITLSHLGAAPSSAFTLLRIKGVLEELLRTSGLAYTIIRSGVVYGPEDAFINHIAMMLSTNPFFFLMPGQGEIVLHPLYVDDLVTVVVRSLDLIETVDQTIEIGGPEYFTLEDLLRTVMRVSRMSRVILPVPPYALRLVTAIYTRVFSRSLMTQQWLDLLAANRTAALSNMYETFRVRPRRFEDTLVTYLPTRRHFVRAVRYVFRRRPREG